MRFALHPGQEVLHSVWVVPCVESGFCEQGERADGSLYLVPDVGDEVTSYGLHPSRLGQIVDNQRHVTVVERLRLRPDGEHPTRETTAVEREFDRLGDPRAPRGTHQL